MQLQMFGDTCSYKSPLSYPGGKKHLWEFFKNFLPKDTNEIISPFIGGGAIELHCSVNNIKVKAADNFEPLVNFWQMLIQDSNHLVDVTRSLYPLNEEIRRFYHKTELLRFCKDEHGEILTNVKRAAIFWCINKQSFNGFTLARGIHSSAEKSSDYFERWRTWTNTNLKVEWSDCFKTIEESNGTFMYLDPPYIGKEHYYGANTNGKDCSFDHEKLSLILSEVESPWILSYGDHPTIRELYKDFEIITPKWKYGSKAWFGGNVNSDELLILNL